MNISDRDLAEAERQLREAREHLANVERMVATAKHRAYPTEPAAIGTLLKFTLRLSKNDGSTKLYRYAAIKATTDRWYTTGATCPTGGWAWRNLIDFIRSADSIEGKVLSQEFLSNDWYRVQV
jgi:hypothetical protein